METDQNYVESLSGVSSDDDDLSTDSSDEEERPSPATTLNAIGPQKFRNLAQMLYDRERTDYFSGRSRAGQKLQLPYDKVPNRLKIHLKDILPSTSVQGHVYMGLTACGQYMISFRVSCNDNSTLNHYSFNVGYVYHIYFWIFKPFTRLKYFFSRRLFDDHVVDNLKYVTMTQWKQSDNSILIVHGAATEEENEESYITYLKVPKLGCSECKKLNEDGPTKFNNLHCAKCNLTVHTKYSSNEADPPFNPYINLLSPERILIISNGFMHMLHIEMDTPVVTNNSTDSSAHPNILGVPITMMSNDEAPVVVTHPEPNTEHSVVDRIIADFSDIESEQGQQHRSNNNNNNNNGDTHVNATCCATTKSSSSSSYEKLIFSANGSNGLSVSVSSMTLPETTLPVPKQNNSIKVVDNDAFQSRKRNQRIVTKSYRNGIPTPDHQSASSSSPADKSNAYEFSEDNEKCEKISTFRKRRLADKKYEFSEDNSENIIPFTKVRSAGRAKTPQFSQTSASPGNRSLHRFSPTAFFFLNSPCASPSSSPHPTHPSQTPPHPSHLGFRSPPSTSSLMRSPSRHAVAVTVSPQIYNQKSPPISLATQQMLSYKPVGPLGALSPLQMCMAKRFENGGSMSPNAGLSFLSPRREEPRIVEMPVQGGVMPEQPVCTKKVQRRFVEEDDATSVITSEEDDCIYPGYHTSLPMEVHGACYSEMQMISQASYQRLRCNSVIITQHSFDLETFIYYIISQLCQKHQKIYKVFYDWAYELVNVCPLSQTISGLLMAMFSARDPNHTNCHFCSARLDCAYHHRKYECRILFTWNMESGKWQVIDYGELKEIHERPNNQCGLSNQRSGKSRLTFAQVAKKLAKEISDSMSKQLPNYSTNLRVLDSDLKKSKHSIIDMDNMIEFHLRRAQC